MSDPIDVPPDGTIILFWQADQSHGFLSNFWRSPFVVNEVHYLHCEQYLHHAKAMLFADTDSASKILATDKPYECKQLGQTVAGFVQQEWDAVKFEIMVQGLRAKFSQQADLEAELLATDNALLAEAAPKDCIWGIGLLANQSWASRPDKWKGLNLLGEALMQVRAELQVERDSQWHPHEVPGTAHDATALHNPDTQLWFYAADTDGKRNGELVAPGMLQLIDTSDMSSGYIQIPGGNRLKVERRPAATRFLSLAKVQAIAKVATAKPSTGTPAATAGTLDSGTLPTQTPSKASRQSGLFPPPEPCARASCGGDAYQNTPGNFCSKSCRDSDKPRCIRTGCTWPSWNHRHGEFCSKKCRNMQPIWGASRQRDTCTGFVRERDSYEGVIQGHNASEAAGGDRTLADHEGGARAKKPRRATRDSPTPEAVVNSAAPHLAVDAAAEHTGTGSALTKFTRPSDLVPQLPNDRQLSQPAGTTDTANPAGTDSAQRFTVADMFAGVSAFGRAFAEQGFVPTGFCELDKDCIALLQWQYPDTEITEDFYDYLWRNWTGELDVLVGGPSCVWASPAGRQQGSRDVRSNQIIDMAMAAKFLQPKVVIVENVIQSQHYTDVMQRMRTAFEDAGYKMLRTFTQQHTVLGGATKRERIFYYYEQRRMAESLPPIAEFWSADEAAADHGVMADYLTPFQILPEHCFITGTIQWKARPSAKPPIIGYITCGGVTSTLQRGSLVQVDNEWGRWRVMSIANVVELMRSNGDRSNCERRWLDQSTITCILEEVIPIYSVWDICKSPRSFGEWPVRTTQLIYDDRAGVECARVRALLPEEVWRLMELTPALLEQARAMGLNDDAVYRIAGNSIAHSMIVPLAIMVKRRLQAATDVWHTPVQRPHSQPDSEDTLAPPTATGALNSTLQPADGTCDLAQGRQSIRGHGTLGQPADDTTDTPWVHNAPGDSDVTPQQQDVLAACYNHGAASWAPVSRRATNCSGIDVANVIHTHVVVLDINASPPMVLMTDSNKLPCLRHFDHTKEWSLNQAHEAVVPDYASAAQLRDSLVFVHAAELNKGQQVMHRVVTAVTDQRLQFPVLRGRWLAASNMTSADLQYVEAALSTMTSLRPADAANSEFAHTRYMHGAGVMGPARLQPPPVDESEHTRSWAEQRLRTEANLRQLQAALHAYQGDPELQADIHAWGDRVQQHSLTDIPQSLLNSRHTYSDDALRIAMFAHRCIPPITRPLPRPTAQSPVPGFNPKSIYDLLFKVVVDVMIPNWVQGQVNDILRYKKNPKAKRRHSGVLAIGQDLMHMPARGKVWDLRWGDVRLLDYEAPIETHLNVDKICSDLVNFPDQELVSFFRYGVDFKSDTDIFQLVMIPHLTSLADGVTSVESELKRLLQLQTLMVMDSVPFMPCRCQAQGAVARKLEPDRFRRVLEAGGPRQPVFDTSDRLVVSLNQELKGYESVTKTAFEADPKAYHRSVTTSQVRERWPREIKPTVAEQAHDLAILKYAAEQAGEPVFMLTDDFKDYFFQYAIAQKMLPRCCILWSSLEGDCTASFVAELGMAMGITISSGVAQRGTQACIYVFNKLMEQAEKDEPEESPILLQWLEDRRPLNHGLSEDGSMWNQARLHTCTGFTDDVWIAVVGVKRCVRAVRCWAQMIHSFGFWMAIPRKRQIGIGVRSLGADIHADAGVVVIPTEKILRAMLNLTATAQGTITFDEYRSLTGLLEHLVILNCSNRSVMNYMYTPMRRPWTPDPTDRVQVTKRMLAQVKRWCDILRTRSGCHLIDAFQLRPIQHTSAAREVHCYSDAALQGAPIPAVGGWIEGFYWHLPISRQMQVVPIPQWEFVGAVCNAIIFHHYLWGNNGRSDPSTDADVVLHVDGLATPVNLARGAAGSTTMQYIHAWLMGSKAYADLGPSMVTMHCAGDRNYLADAASRGLFRDLHHMSSRLGIQPLRLAVPYEARLLMCSVYALHMTILETALWGMPARLHGPSCVLASPSGRQRATPCDTGEPGASKVTDPGQMVWQPHDSTGALAITSAEHAAAGRAFGSDYSSDNEGDGPTSSGPSSGRAGKQIRGTTGTDTPLVTDDEHRFFADDEHQLASDMAGRDDPTQAGQEPSNERLAGNRLAADLADCDDTTGVAMQPDTERLATDVAGVSNTTADILRSLPHWGPPKLYVEIKQCVKQLLTTPQEGAATQAPRSPPTAGAAPMGAASANLGSGNADAAQAQDDDQSDRISSNSESHQPPPLLTTFGDARVIMTIRGVITDTTLSESVHVQVEEMTSCSRSHPDASTTHILVSQTTTLREALQLAQPCLPRQDQCFSDLDMWQLLVGKVNGFSLIVCKHDKARCLDWPLNHRVIVNALEVLDPTVVAPPTLFIRAAPSPFNQFCASVLMPHWPHHVDDGQAAGPRLPTHSNFEADRDRSTQDQWRPNMLIKVTRPFYRFHLVQSIHVRITETSVDIVSRANEIVTDIIVSADLTLRGALHYAHPQPYRNDQSYSDTSRWLLQLGSTCSNEVARGVQRSLTGMHGITVFAHGNLTLLDEQLVSPVLQFFMIRPQDPYSAPRTLHIRAVPTVINFSPARPHSISWTGFLMRSLFPTVTTWAEAASCGLINILTDITLAQTTYDPSQPVSPTNDDMWHDWQHARSARTGLFYWYKASQQHSNFYWEGSDVKIALCTTTTVDDSLWGHWYQQYDWLEKRWYLTSNYTRPIRFIVPLTMHTHVLRAGSLPQYSPSTKNGSSMICPLCASDPDPHYAMDMSALALAASTRHNCHHAHCERHKSHSRGALRHVSACSPWNPGDTVRPVGARPRFALYTWQQGLAPPTASQGAFKIIGPSGGNPRLTTMRDSPEARSEGFAHTSSLLAFTDPIDRPIDMQPEFFGEHRHDGDGPIRLVVKDQALHMWDAEFHRAFMAQYDTRYNVTIYDHGVDEGRGLSNSLYDPYRALTRQTTFQVLGRETVLQVLEGLFPTSHFLSDPNYSFYLEGQLKLQSSTREGWMRVYTDHPTAFQRTTFAESLRQDFGQGMRIWNRCLNIMIDAITWAPVFAQKRGKTSKRRRSEQAGGPSQNAPPTSSKRPRSPTAKDTRPGPKHTARQSSHQDDDSTVPAAAHNWWQAPAACGAPATSLTVGSEAGAVAGAPDAAPYVVHETTQEQASRVVVTATAISVDSEQQHEAVVAMGAAYSSDNGGDGPLLRRLSSIVSQQHIGIVALRRSRAPANSNRLPTSNVLSKRRAQTGPTHVIEKRSRSVQQSATQQRRPPTAATHAIVLPSQHQSQEHSLLGKLQCDDSAYALRPKSWQVVSKWCDLTERFRARSFNQRTITSDCAAVNKYWVPFCTSMRTPMIRRLQGVMSPGHPDWERECLLFALFLMYVYEHIRPKRKSDAQAKPASVLAILLAVRREHKRLGLEHNLPSHKSIAPIVKGMTLEFKDMHGSEALLPDRKEPISATVTRRLMTLPNGTVLKNNHVVNRNDFLHRSFALAVGCAKDTGARKAELTNDADAPDCASRASIAWFVGDNETSTEISEPTLTELANMYHTTDTVTMAFAHGPSKADPTGERYGNFFSYIKLQHDEGNTALQMLRMEMDFPVLKRADRARTPLVGPSFGTAFTSKQLDALFNAALATVAVTHPTELSSDRLCRYSWHSFRISLASRLRPHCDDSTIQTMCRWATPNTLRLYGRMGRKQYADLLELAAHTQLDSMQAASLWRDCPSIGDDDRCEFAHSLAVAMEANDSGLQR